MTGRASAKLRAYVAGGLVAMAAALAIGQPEPALFGTVLIGIAVVGLVSAEPARIDLELGPVPGWVVEGGHFDLEVTLRSDRPLRRVNVDLDLRKLELGAVSGATMVDRTTVLVRRVDAVTSLRLTLRASSWGEASLGPIRLHAESSLGVVHLDDEEGPTSQVLVVPGPGEVKTLLTPVETNLHVGDLVSVGSGVGSEFADIRRYLPGDEERSLNWRVSSRTGERWVNTRHPERNGDVILLVDGQVETGTGLALVVDRSVRLASWLLQTHARRRHRLGVVTLDGLCRWVSPGMGEAHRLRLLAQLATMSPAEVIWEAAERAVLRAARRPALVIVLTSLLDPELVGIAHAVHRRGVDVCLVVVDVAPLLPEPIGEARTLGRRIWAMDRERLLERLAAEGVASALWREGEPPDVPLARIQQWRSAWRRHA